MQGHSRRAMLGWLAGCVLASWNGTASAAPLPASGLVDQDGVAVSADRWHGRIVVLDFFFASCGGTCPLKTLELAEVQHKLPADLQSRVAFVSISIDPELDRPAMLRGYALAHGADLANWTFVTGTVRTIDALVSHYGVLPPGPGAQLRHTNDIRLIGPNGAVIQRYAGAPLDVDRLAREIQALAARDTATEAATGPGGGGAARTS